MTRLLCYCANVRPGETLAEVLAACRDVAGAVRRELLADRLGLGLWLSQSALTELRAQGTARLKETLDAQGLYCFTLNGFPYGDFHAPVVKHAVYAPDWTTPARQRYSLELAEALTELLPAEVTAGTISSLPIGHRTRLAAGARPAAAERLCALAEDLRRLADRSGKPIRLCLEPEPGCELETTADAIRFFTQDLPAAARRTATSTAAVEQHLGVCFDTCHQALAFEDPAASLAALEAAGVTVGKLQLSSALELSDPSSAEARHALAAFDEPRYLHQVRARARDGRVIGVDDLDQAHALPQDTPWRVHFHVPIHRAGVGPLGTTRPVLEQTLEHIVKLETPPHLEVETYTWSVLPEAERPRDAAGLARGLAEELRWAAQTCGVPFGATA